MPHKTESEDQASPAPYPVQQFTIAPMFSSIFNGKCCTFSSSDGIIGNRALVTIARDEDVVICQYARIKNP